MFNNLGSPLHRAVPGQLSALIESRASVLGEKTSTYPDSTAAALEHTYAAGKVRTAQYVNEQACVHYAQTLYTETETQTSRLRTNLKS